MPIYMRFLLNGLPTGGTTAAGHHNNGMDILGISWSAPTMAPSLNEIVVTKLTDVPSTNLYPLFDPGFAGGLTVAASAGDRPAISTRCPRTISAPPTSRWSGTTTP